MGSASNRQAASAAPRSRSSVLPVDFPRARSPGLAGPPLLANNETSAPTHRSDRTQGSIGGTDRPSRHTSKVLDGDRTATYNGYRMKGSHYKILTSGSIRRLSWVLALGCIPTACGPGKQIERTTESATSETSAALNETSTGMLPTDGMTSDAGSSSTSTGVTGGSAPSCNPFGQDCPEGEKCVAYAADGGDGFDANKCVEVMGKREPGEPCMGVGIDDCVEGAMCWPYAGGYQCVAQCGGSEEAPVCPDELPCTIGTGAFLALCLPFCDPLLQDCPDDWMCVFSGYSLDCVHDDSNEDGQVNDYCGLPTACDKGLTCLETAKASSACDPQGEGCCQPFCKFPDALCPNADQSCVQVFSPIDFPPGDPRLEIGVCSIPP